MKSMIRLATCALTVLLAACATAPAVSPEVNEAKGRVESLAQSPLATQAANDDLAAARSALSQAEMALEQREDTDVVIHLAYLAERRAEIGLERVKEAEARQRISKAENERNAALVEARSAEARTAEAAAQASRESALQAQAELEGLRSQYAALAAKQTDRGMVLTLGDVLFDTAQATLKPGASAEIERLASFLKEHGETRVRIEGHTDSVGSEAYNNDLSRRRAHAVSEALINLGVSSERIEVVARGERMPVVGNDTPAGRQQNRRVEIVFSDPAGSFVRDPQAISSTQP